MRTDDLLALCSHPRAEHRRAFRGAGVVIGAAVAACLVITALVEAAAPSAQAFVSNSQDAALAGISKKVDRTGFPGLPVLF
jgi:hydroxymethylpyrimidine/phosphomethylpyrimidine kinase